MAKGLMIKDFLKKYKIRPLKRLGQNFLINEKVLGKIIEAADLSKNDMVLEIGPGLGILTLELAKKVKKVIAIEKDIKMVEILKETLRNENIKNVEIVKSDILKIGNWKLEIDWKLKIGNWKLIANIPFYITAPLIRKFLEISQQPEFMVLMVQKEVAQRICASPPHQKFGVGARPPKMSLLSVAVQFYAQPKIIDYVSKKSFWPQPKVDSAIIKIIPYSSLSVIARSEATKQSRTLSDKVTGLPRSPNGSLAMTLFRDKFFKIVKAGFSHPRKQLINNFSQSLNLDKEKIRKILLKSKIDPSLRAEALTVDNWKKLASYFNKNMLK